MYKFSDYSAERVYYFSSTHSSALTMLMQLLNQEHPIAFTLIGSSGCACLVFHGHIERHTINLWRPKYTYLCTEM
jgi:hypothetical protein